MTDLADRIERDADAIIQELTERTNRQHECIEAKDAEIARYREALEKIRYMPQPSFFRSFSREARMEKIARQALQDTDNG